MSRTAGPRGLMASDAGLLQRYPQIKYLVAVIILVVVLIMSLDDIEEWRHKAKEHIMAAEESTKNVVQRSLGLPPAPKIERSYYGLTPAELAMAKEVKAEVMREVDALVADHVRARTRQVSPDQPYDSPLGLPKEGSEPPALSGGPAYEPSGWSDTQASPTTAFSAPIADEHAYEPSGWSDALPESLPEASPTGAEVTEAPTEVSAEGPTEAPTEAPTARIVMPQSPGPTAARAPTEAGRIVKGARTQFSEDELITSLGKVQPLPVTGDLEAEGVLEQVAAARAYRNELILFTTNYGYSLQLENILYNLREVGLENYVLVTISKETCDKLAVEVPHVACTWTSYLQDHAQTKHTMSIGGLVHLCATKWHYMYRLLALGYNVLSLDEDLSLRMNPYAILKTTFKTNTVIGMREDGTAYPINAGVVYVQNAAPDGGAIWAFRQLSRHFVRVMDTIPLPQEEYDERKLDWLWSYIPRDITMWSQPRSQWRPLAWRDMVWDQAVLNDMLESACIGVETLRRVLFRVCIDDQGPNWMRKDGVWEGYTGWILEKDDEYFPDGILSRGWPVGPDLYGNTTMQTCVMRVPRQRAPGEKIDFTEVRDGLPQSIAGEESMVMAPGWLFAGWRHGDGGAKGTWGFWNNHPPVSVIEHMVGVDSIIKQRYMQILGWWKPGLEAGLGKHQITEGSRHKVLTLAPVNTSTAEGYKAEAAKLLHWGALLQRLVAQPLIDCSSPWIEHGDHAFWHGIQVKRWPQQSLEQMIVGRCELPSRAYPSGGAQPGLQEVEEQARPCCHFNNGDSNTCQSEVLGSQELMYPLLARNVSRAVVALTEPGFEAVLAALQGRPEQVLEVDASTLPGGLPEVEDAQLGENAVHVHQKIIKCGFDPWEDFCKRNNMDCDSP